MFSVLDQLDSTHHRGHNSARSALHVQIVTELYLYIFQVMYNKLEDSRVDSTLSIVRHHFRTTYFINYLTRLLPVRSLIKIGKLQVCEFT